MKKRKKIKSSEKSVSVSWMLIFSFAVGIIGGFGAIVFRSMIGFVSNISFDGKFSFLFDTNTHLTKSIWGVGIIFVPVIGALIVTWITQRFASEARGHGVPEVMNAIYYKEGKIRPMVAVVKAIASSISIGTGGSVGREGPIIQIGAAFGSLLGQVFKTSTRQRIVLIAAGAAAGIAATFNTPIGGLAFAIELMLVTISAVNVAVVGVAVVTATMLTNLIIGVHPAFYIPSLSDPLVHALNPFIVVSFVPFGVITGVVAALFIHSIYWFEDKSAELVKNPYFRHALGMFLLGIMLYMMMRYTGQYYVAGVGYSTILDVLNGVLSNPFFLLALCVLKLIATGLTLGTGASGGVFSPSLFIGATLGAAYGTILNHLFPGIHIPVVLYTITGMAAMVGGSTGAVLTAITMTFEQTRDYSDILPIMLSVAITYVVRVKITNESIYTLKLHRRGLNLPQGLQAAISVAKRAYNFMERKFALIDISEVTAWTQQQSGETDLKCAVVIEQGEIIGTLRRELNYLVSGVDVDMLIDKSFLIMQETATWPTVMRRMNAENANVIIVIRHRSQAKPENIVGIITRLEVFKSSQEVAKLLGES